MRDRDTDDENRLSRAKRGPLDDAELDWLVFELASETAPTRKYRLLLTLGKGGGPELRGHVEPFLADPDPELQRLALQVLVQYWRLGGDYRDVMLERLGPPADDDVGGVRAGAIGCAGIYLADHEDRRLLHRLTEIARDLEESEINRAACIFSLGKALHEEWAFRSGFSERILSETELVQSVLNRARELTADT